VVGLADVGGALATIGTVVGGTELAGVALGAARSDEPHAASNPTHITTATRLALLIRRLLGSRPDTRSSTKIVLVARAAPTGPNVTVGAPAGGTTA
jgi:hypothetical protein